MVRVRFQAVRERDTHLQRADPLTKIMDKDILVALFNCRKNQSTTKKTHLHEKRGQFKLDKIEFVHHTSRW